MRETLLAVHIAAGVAALVLGPIAMFAAKRRGRHTRAGDLYFWVYVVLVLAAFALAATDWDEAWFLVPIGAFSFAFALLGYVMAKRRPRGWLRLHVTGQGGSYIAMITALLVVNLGGETLIVWFIPTIIGSPVIAYVNTQIALGRRPKGRPDLVGRGGAPRPAALPGPPRP
jgi:hypothetical protein